jgi:hypothetical protein
MIGNRCLSERRGLANRLAALEALLLTQNHSELRCDVELIVPFVGETFAFVSRYFLRD